MTKASSTRNLLEIPVRRLRSFCDLSTIDEAVLRSLTVRNEEVCADDAVELGARQLWIVLSGWACSLQRLHDGRRQIFALLLPGDVIGDVHHGRSKLRPSIQAVSPMLLADASPLVPAEGQQAPRHPTLLRALAEAQAQRDSYIYDHVVRLGARSAYERVGHLMLEIYDRLAAVGLTNGDEFLMPLTQGRLGEMLGLSETHVNRTVRQLRADGLLRGGSGWVALPDRERLAQAAGLPMSIPMQA